MLERIGYGVTNISNQDLFAFFNNYALFVCTETKNDSLLSFLDFFWCGAFPNFHVIENATYFIRNLNSWGLWWEQNVQNADNNYNFKYKTRHFGSRLASAHTTITDFRQCGSHFHTTWEGNLTVAASPVPRSQTDEWCHHCQPTSLSLGDGLMDPRLHQGLCVPKDDYKLLTFHVL